MNLLSLIPGGLLCFVLFVLFFAPITMFIFKSFKRKLDLIEISLISLSLSLVIVPLIAWIINFILPFNYILLGITFLIPLLISLSLIFTKRVTIDNEILNVSKSSLIILFIVFVAFFLRAQSLSSFFYEFDPYWYGMVTQFLVEDGFIPQYDDLGYNVAGTSSHRTLPLTHHLTSTWYLLLAGDTYNNLDNAYIMNLYPPILGALIAFWAYFFFRQEYGNWIAIAAAIVLSFMPILLQKFLGGVAEQLPWGLAFGFAGIVFLHFALNSKNRIMYIPFLVMLIGAILGSKAGMLPLMVGIGYIGLCAVKDFILKNQNKVYYELSLAIMCVVLLMNFLHLYYLNYDFSRIFIDEEFLFAFFTFIVSLFFYHFDSILSKVNLSKNKIFEDRLKLTGAFTILGILFLLTIGAPFLNYIVKLAQVGMVGESALMKTVAEENLYSGVLTSKFGAIGLSLDITNFTRPLTGEYGSLDALPLIYIPLILAFIYGFFLRKDNFLLLILIFVLGISIIGLQKVKFTPHLALVLGLALITVAGESFKFMKDKKENDLKKYLGYSIILLFGLMGLYALITNINPLISFLSKDVVKTIIVLMIVLPILYYLGSRIHKEKIYDGVFAFALILFILPHSINFVDVIPYSISNLNVDGTNYTEVLDFCNNVAKGGSTFATSFYCPIIPQYWYDSMMFIRDKTPEDTRVLSWWDYGHWTNFFGMRNTVTRNDHPAGAEENEVVADKFVHNDEQALKEYMDLTGSQYVMFDQDLIGKWGALTYLSCVFNGETSSDELPAQSQCSAEHQFERIYISTAPTLNERCVIGEKFGIIAYSSFSERGYCVINEGQTTFIFNPQTQEVINAVPLSMGAQNINGVKYNTAMMIYLPDALDSAPGRGYKSIFYKAFFLGELDGFEQVYPSTKGIGLNPIRIYRKV